MAEQNKSDKPHWLHTIPGMLTAIAAVITAFTGLIIGLNQTGWFSSSTTTELPSNDMAAPPIAQQEAAPTDKTTQMLSPNHTLPAKKGMGRVTTSQGAFQFDRISGMSMGHGKLTVSEFGAKTEIPLHKIAKITFLEDNLLQIVYKNGRSESAKSSCSWNTPVTFYSGKKKIYYGDCAALEIVSEIELY